MTRLFAFPHGNHAHLPGTTDGILTFGNCDTATILLMRTSNLLSKLPHWLQLCARFLVGLAIATAYWIALDGTPLATIAPLAGAAYFAFTATTHQQRSLSFREVAINGVVLIGAVGASLTVCLFSGPWHPFWLTGLAVSFLAAVWVGQFCSGRRKLLSLVLLTTPPMPAVPLAVLAYATGDACSSIVMGSGHHAPPQLDRQSRFCVGYTGCVETPVHSAIRSIRTVTLQGLHFMLGPMPHTYIGPFPTLEQATIALQKGSELTRYALRAGELRPSEHELVHLAPNLGRDLDKAFFGEPQSTANSVLIMAKWSSVIVLEVRHSSRASLLAFIDSQSGRVFSYDGDTDAVTQPWLLPDWWTPPISN